MLPLIVTQRHDSVQNGDASSKPWPRDRRHEEFSEAAQATRSAQGTTQTAESGVDRDGQYPDEPEAGIGESDENTIVVVVEYVDVPTKAGPEPTR